MRVKTFVVPVDFDYIDDARCRRRFKNMATSWTLDDEDNTGLIAMGGALLRKSPDFTRLLDVYGLPATPGPDVAEACADLLGE